ncbi:MAG: RES family NAD+ phosphorylase [Gammaproteobacteria bacterium]|nr:RES family NAD+ phosphorylase [Gammaproteobacteria bacterium]
MESQERVASHTLVDTLDEQSLLEELLEETKPAFPTYQGSLHYLLSTPFRYPPLLWGSRFGQQIEPSLFYGSKRFPTALAEMAFYRLLFCAGMQSPPLSGVLTTQHLLFRISYRVERAVSLQLPPFQQYQPLLMDRKDYRATQALGSLLREEQVEAFEYRSARCPDGSLNVALFSPQALSCKKPLEQQRWICETSAEQVLFSGEGKLLRFAAESFLVAGQLPQPA